MRAITIEFSDRIEGDPCPCCGGRTTRMTRFVYCDGDARAVYYGAFSNNHPDRYVSLAISLGEWGEGATPDARLAFALRIRSTEAEFQVMVVDAAESPWRDVAFLGRMLDRKEALQHPWIEEVFHITDHIVSEDHDVRDYLNGNAAAEP
jgi:hypothetical protein